LIPALAVVNRQSALGMTGVSALEPGRDFAFERGSFGEAAAETLTAEHGQLRFRHVEPAAVQGCVTPLKARHGAARLTTSRAIGSAQYMTNAPPQLATQAVALATAAAN
jgi:hypothetical protein